MSASADFAGTYLSADSVFVRSRYVRSTPTEVPTGGGKWAFIFPSSHLGRPRTYDVTELFCGPCVSRASPRLGLARACASVLDDMRARIMCASWTLFRVQPDVPRDTTWAAHGRSYRSPRDGFAYP